MYSKKNIYIVLTIVFLFGIIFLQNFYITRSSFNKEIKYNISLEKIHSGHPVVVLISSFYLFLFFIGIINLSSLLIKKISKKHFKQSSLEIKFSLSEEKISLLFFIIISFTFLLYIIGIIFLYVFEINNIALTIIMNFILQIGIILIILKFLFRDLVFNIKNTNIKLILKLYTMTFSVVVILQIINTFFIEKTASKVFPTLPIVIFLLLKDKILFTLFILQIVLFGPIAEELFFRGFLYKLMRTKFSFIFSSIFVSVLFAILHKDKQNLIILAIVSIALCYIYEKTQSIINPIIFHILHNSIVLLFFFFIRHINLI